MSPERSMMQDGQANGPSKQPNVTVLVVDDEERIRKLVSLGLRRAGYKVDSASDGREALAQIEESKPDLIVSDVMMPDMDGFSLLSTLREDSSMRDIPLIFLTAKGSADDLVRGLGLGADDYLAKPFDMGELLARVRSKVERPPVPSEQLPRERQTGLLSERVFRQEVEYELTRFQRGGITGALAYLNLAELPSFGERLDSNSRAQLVEQVLELIADDDRPLDLVSRDDQGRFVLLLPETEPRAARQWLEALLRKIVGHSFVVAEERLAFTPTVGFAAFTADISAGELRDQAIAASEYAATHTDLRPVRYDPKVHGVSSGSESPTWTRLLAKLRLSSQAVPSREVIASEDPAPSASSEHRGGMVLVVDDEERIRKLVSIGLRRAGYAVTVASNGTEALAQIAEVRPDLIVSDVMMPDMDGLSLLSALREDPSTQAIPLIFLTARGSTDDLIAGLGLGADDYLPKPFDMGELVARVHSKIERPPVPSGQLSRERQTGLMNQKTFWREVEYELIRFQRGGRPGALAYLQLVELLPLRERLGSQSMTQLVREVIKLIEEDNQPLNLVGRDDEGRFLLLLPEFDHTTIQKWLEALSSRIAQNTFLVAGESITLTPAIGFTPFTTETLADELRDQAFAALSYSATHLDLRPVRYDPKIHVIQPKSEPGWLNRLLTKLRLPFQVSIVELTPLLIPFVLYVMLYAMGIDVSLIVYLLVLLALLVTAHLIWYEGLLALRPVDPPGKHETVHPTNKGQDIQYCPPASAIIAAYLPNEAATVVETIEAFLRVEYLGSLQVILAYNTPLDLPIEQVLHDIARRDPRFLPLRVENSTSKAQNVNAALAKVSGEFVGVFDADHQPDPNSFNRAWHWLSNGYDVVQGHCLVRNGDESWVARMVAVEFEVIYAVSHPGRARLHRFGVFGGSNGYWKTDLLHRTRMRGSMLTEDIDSSLRVVEAGYKIASDPLLISRELAPTELKALWNQRMRWAQGWFQVSLKHLWLGLRSPHLSLRQKLGFLHLLGWREIYVWLSIQVFPIIGFWAWRDGGLQNLNWFVPIFVLTTLFTLSVGPGQTLFAYLLASPEIRRHKLWFLFFLVVSSPFYPEFKNLIAKVAQIKEIMGEKKWKITPRTSSVDTKK